jgi:hypothetical protein
MEGPPVAAALQHCRDRDLLELLQIGEAEGQGPIDETSHSQAPACRVNRFGRRRPEMAADEERIVGRDPLSEGGDIGFRIVGSSHPRAEPTLTRKSFRVSSVPFLGPSPAEEILRPYGGKCGGGCGQLQDPPPGNGVP